MEAPFAKKLLPGDLKRKMGQRSKGKNDGINGINYRI
jgi:hypothetical protein